MAKKRRPCDVCGSRLWIKTASQVVCSEGHVLEGYRNETNEKDDFGPHALHKRTLKSQRVRKDAAGDPNIYHGRRARFLYFQCLQFLFRTQATALTRMCGLPPEFMIICRDLWALHLRLLSNPPPPEPLDFLRGGPEREPYEFTGPTQKPPNNTSVSSSIDLNKAFRDSSSEADDNDNEDAKLQENEELQALLEESILSSSSSEDDVEEQDELGSEASEDADTDASDPGSGQGNKKKKRRRRKALKRREEQPIAGLAVLVVACWTLRAPIIYRDLIELVMSYDLPYLDVYRRGIYPPEMAKHMNRSVRRALSPSHIPPVGRLHGLSAHLARLLRSQFGIITPEANAAPVLWRSVRAMGGSAVIYAATKRLARKLALPLTLEPKLAPARTGREPPTHSLDESPLELAFVCAVVIVLKLVYGLDGRKRDQPHEGFAATLPSLSAYMRLFEAACRTDTARMRDLFDPRQPIGVADLDDAELDALLDMGEKALLPASNNEVDDDIMRNIFPMISAERLSNNVERSSRGSSQVNSEDEQDNEDHEDEEGPAAWEGYKIFLGSDVCGVPPAGLQAIVERAAQWTCYSVDDVYTLVERYERRLFASVKKDSR